MVNREANYQETNRADYVGMCEDSEMNYQKIKNNTCIRIYEDSHH